MFRALHNPLECTNAFDDRKSLLTNILSWLLLICIPVFTLVLYLHSNGFDSSIFLVTFLAPLLISLLLIVTGDWHSRWSSDQVSSGVQKTHSNHAVRIGGLAIMPVVLFATLFLDTFYFKLALCGVPVFAAGIVEDITKKVSAQARLVFSFLSGLMGAVLLDVALPGVGIPLLDWLFVFPVVALPFTAFAVAGVVNAINIIDGFNGLASGVVGLISGLLGFVAFHVGDSSLAWFAFLIAAVAFGFNTVNYYTGKIFLGDGGAYYFGFLLASIAVLLVLRNPSVSPWLVFMIFSYPVSEVVVSMVRRKLKKANTNQPDQGHLHHAIWRLIQKKNSPVAMSVVMNSAVSKWIWLYVWLTAGLAYVAFPVMSGWNGVAFGLLSVVLYCVVYLLARYFTDRQTA